MNLLLALLLTSATLANGATVPRAMVAVPCGGQNRSPQLSWSAVPRGAVSFALIIHDVDAPHPGGFYHWVLYDLPRGTRFVRSGTTPAGAAEGVNGTGATGYFGPCPPPGRLHHYHITLYALDTRIRAAQPLTAPQLLDRMRGHVLAQAEIVGVFAKP